MLDARQSWTVMMHDTKHTCTDDCILFKLRTLCRVLTERETKLPRRNESSLGASPLEFAHRQCCAATYGGCDHIESYFLGLEPSLYISINVRKWCFSSANHLYFFAYESVLWFMKETYLSNEFPDYFKGCGLYNRPRKFINIFIALKERGAHC